jgi:hypothetical protein
MNISDKKVTIIAGDSWSVGEWLPNNGTPMILHGGLTEYLHEDGHVAINVGLGGSSNRESYLRARNLLFNNHHLRLFKNKQIIVFQTEWTRDFLYMDPEDKNYYDRPTELMHRIISRFYFDLSALSQEWNINIKVIGGCSDALMIEDFKTIYTGVEVICQSMINLLLNDYDIVKNPVYSFFSADHRGEDFLKLFKQHVTDISQMQSILDEVDKGQRRYETFAQRPDLFYPDGAHPNREAHKILFEFLKRNNRI